MSQFIFLLARFSLSRRNKKRAFFPSILLYVYCCPCKESKMCVVSVILFSMFFFASKIFHFYHVKTWIRSLLQMQFENLFTSNRSMYTNEFIAFSVLIQLSSTLSWTHTNTQRDSCSPLLVCVSVFLSLCFFCLLDINSEFTSCRCSFTRSMQFAAVFFFAHKNGSSRM